LQEVTWDEEGSVRSASGAVEKTPLKEQIPSRLLARLLEKRGNRGWVLKEECRSSSFRKTFCVESTLTIFSVVLINSLSSISRRAQDRKMYVLKFLILKVENNISFNSAYGFVLRIGDVPFRKGESNSKPILPIVQLGSSFPSIKSRY
jgi:hypothetical protein